MFFQSRQYATLKDSITPPPPSTLVKNNYSNNLVQMRLKAIKNIGKITSSMKMIASTKLSRAQKAMNSGQEFEILKHLEIIPATGKDYLSTTATSKDEGDGFTWLEGGNNGKRLLLACSSDRGLCGGIHSSISKAARKLASLNRENTQIAVLGDKVKPQISRDAKGNIIISFVNVGKNIPTFQDSLAICQTLRNEGLLVHNNIPLDVGIITNRFVSVIAFDTCIIKKIGVSDLKKSPILPSYEIENDSSTAAAIATADLKDNGDDANDDSVLGHLSEYLFANRLFWALVEGHAAEMSSKRTCMENATKNAGEIVVGLTMKYNRTRQAVITNELVDIIVGASAL